MFTRIKPPEPEFNDRLSRPAPLNPPSDRRLRWAKRALALAIFVIGCLSLLTDADYVTSDNAVVTAHVVSLRAPIEGIVTADSGAIGQQVGAGEVLVRIENPLADDRPVATLRARLDRLQTEVEAAQGERAALVAILEEMRRRADRHRVAKLSMLALQATRLDRDRTAKQAELEQLVRNMARKQLLRGVISQADIEQAETAVQIAARQVQSFDEQLAAAEAEHASAAEGVSVEQNGGADVAYSSQRADGECPIVCVNGSMAMVRITRSAS